MRFFPRSVLTAITALSISILLSTFSSASAATFIVNSTSDGADSSTSDGVCDDGTGNCTLRAAIMQANATSGADRINFQIGTGTQTIKPSYPGLPVITDPVTIDGSTQPGFAGSPLIELSGINFRDVTGLRISAGNSLVRSLVINYFSFSGIGLYGNGGNHIEGCYIGTNVAGTMSLFNGTGISISSSNNVVGSTTREARNVISGNNSYGIYIGNANPSQNVIQGNYIGVSTDGTTALSNGGDGIALITPSSDAPYITDNIIGGTAPGAGNVISGNKYHGVNLSGFNVTGTIIQGNLIGTNAEGRAALPNGGNNVDILHSRNNVIGGTAPGTRNVISGATYTGYTGGSAIGVAVEGNGNVVQGNLIGTDVTGTAPIPNQNTGVYVSGSNNTIGGTASGEGNLIAFSGIGNGVGVGPNIINNASLNNTIRGNSIFSNGKLGISFNSNGATLNDTGDGDTGANNLQNFPVLQSVTSDAGITTIQGTLNSSANAAFLIDLYANDTCDPSGYGEGARFIGTTTETTDAGGNASFSASFPITLSAGQVVTATATDPAGNTSEFSICYEVGRPGTVQFSLPSYDVYENAGSIVITVTRTYGTANTATVDYATSDGTATAGSDYTITSGTLVFGVGEATKTFNVPILNDTISENSESINLTLSNPTGGIVFGSQSTALISIRDDEPPLPSLYITSRTFNEESIGQTVATIAVILNYPNNRTVTVHYTTADNTASAGSDYTATSGTLTFAQGQTSKAISIPIIGDTLDESDETFFVLLSNPTNASISNGQGLITILDNDPDSGTSGEILISEFRTSGPAGANDEFVELYNNTDAPIDLRNYNLSVINSSGATSGRSFATLLDYNAILPARKHFLVTNPNGFSLDAYSIADSTVGGTDFFPDNHGIALRRNGSDAQVDAVGFTSDDAGFREGAGLAVVSSFPSPAPEYSYLRKLTATATQDTDDNASDFMLVSTTGEMLGGVQSVLGAPAPENFDSPILHNDVEVSLIDPASPRLSSPNFVRTGSGNSGTLAIRRHFTNNTGVALTRIRFRVTDITTLGSPLVLAPPQADLRLANSADESITTSLGIPITLKGTTLEQPPTQNIGGGLNSSLSVQLPNGGLANGQSIDVQFLLNVVQNGRYRFFFNVEALP